MLPNDDGRGPGEEWPWRRSEDYVPAIRWRRHGIIFALFMCVGWAVSYVTVLGVWAYILVLCGAIWNAFQGIRFDRDNPWPEYKLRNLAAADHRANRSLEAVDPAFATEMGLGTPDPDMVAPPPPPPDARRRYEGGMTSGDFNPNLQRHYPDESDLSGRYSDDDLPF